MNVNHLLIHSVTRAAYNASTVGTKGDPLHGAQATIRARVEKVTKLVKTRDGREVIAGHRMVTTTAIREQDRFWMPALGGEPADDTSSANAGRSPLSVEIGEAISRTTTLYVAYFA